jgi:16S rRNA G966 N2-methylase RsmD
VLLQGAAADIVFADPPYNVPNTGHASTRDDVREFVMAHGELSSEQFTDFLKVAAAHVAANVRDGAVIYICMDWRHLDNL